MTTREEEDPAVRKQRERRRFIRMAAAGTLITALGGGCFRLLDDAATREARELQLPDGRPRLPPGQRLIQRLKPMGGDEGDPSPARFRMRVHGAVKKPLTVDFARLLAMPRTEQTCDVHCVTGWSVFDSHWKGVRVAELAELAGVRPEARHVIFEAAHGYTANVPLDEALRPNVLVAYRLDGDPLEAAHGSPVRGLVPDLYFWKSAKWLTGIRFEREDEPGYWETRGYHNHADPWLEERYG